MLDAEIRVLPISRQTNLVDGDMQHGIRIGSSHAADVLATFGEDYLASQGNVFYIFLDVEGNDLQPHLSVVGASPKVHKLILLTPI